MARILYLAPCVTSQLMDTFAWLNSLPKNGDLHQQDRERLQSLFDGSRKQLHGISAAVPHVNICRQACNSNEKLREIKEMIAATLFMLSLIDRLP